MEKKVGRFWFYWGRSSGFNLGIHIDRYHWTIDFLCWYVGWEF